MCWRIAPEIKPKEMFRGIIVRVRETIVRRYRGRHCFYLMYGLLDQIFTIQELANLQGTGVDRARPGEDKPVLEQEKLAVLRDGKPFLKLVRLIVCIWMGTMIAGLYFLEQDEQSEARNARPKGKCQSRTTFNGTFKENLQKLKNIVFNESLPWIHRLDSIATKSQQATSFPVFVTAASESFFVRSQGLLKSIIDRLMPVYNGLKIIYFDLGLTPAQRHILERNCKCEIRQIPLKSLPKHVQDPSTYAFKPVIINLMYQEFGHVWWLDASARFVSNELDLPLKYLKETGILFFTFDRSSNIATRTAKQTFYYFKEDPCLYTNFGEIDASRLAFRKTRANDVILRQWLSCALDQNCIAPKNVNKYCKSENTMVIGQCHRYDQSALGIILRRLYHKQNDYPMVETPFRIIEIRRKENIPFFFDPEQFENEIRKQKKSTQKLP